MTKSKGQRVADYLMSRLADEGVQDIFFLPGGGVMHLNDALVCEPRINGIACHHEQACGISAEAYGRVHPAGFGVALVTTGPGATNVLTPVVGAWIESLPLLVISGQVKRSDSLRGRKLRQSGVQEVDIISMVKSVTKFAVTINQPEDIRICLEEALWHMFNGRPGPVWIDIPLDIQGAPVDFSSLVGFSPKEIAKASNNELQSVIQNMEKILSKSKRPLILAGHGVRISGGVDIFRQVVERYRIPCVFTWNAADLLHWEHELYVGRPGVVAARAPNFAIQNCDCLISIGCRLDNVITAYDPKGFARGAKKIIIDVDPNELARHQMSIELSVCSDALDFLEAWNEYDMKATDWTEWRVRCSDWKERYNPLDNRIFNEEEPVSHFQFVDKLSDSIPENRLVITGSSGLAIEAFYTAFRNKLGQRVFLTSGLGSMGYGLPAAIGACIGSGRKPTICAESDGSLMLNLQELAVLKGLNLPITLIIMNNNGYASIRNTQKNYFNGRYIGTGSESGLHMPDFIKIADAMGFHTMRITKSSDLIPQFEKVLNRNGPSVCEVCLLNNEVLTPKVAALPQPDGTIISMPLEDMSPLLPREILRKEMIVPLHNNSENLKV